VGKFLDQKTLLNELDTARANKRVVFTNGCFDILHVGHVKYLEEAKAQGDLLVVGLNTDASVKRLKGEERPINNESDRAEVLAALSSVDYVTTFDEDTPLELIKSVSPDVLVKGGDWPIEKIVGHEHVLEKGGEVKSLQFVEGKSSSDLIEKLKSL
jgi:D-beta-D-heptose 7-phosphate kinase/D-beta-D-heptose 1-phosphate adenosyltransferase